MLRFAELALEAGLPEGVLNVVVGGADAGAALAGHPGVDKITFTGGGATARALMGSAAGNLTPVALELGGKSPNIVFPDADLEAAATSACLGTALLSGQGCALPTRLYVHDDVYDEVVGLVVSALGHRWPSATRSTRRRSSARWSPRRPWSASWPPSTGPGPTGPSSWPAGTGWKESWPPDGSWPPPCSAGSTTTATWPATRCSAPCRPCCASPPTTRPWLMANDSPYGLGAYLHTHDLRRIQRFVREIEAGTVAVNGMGRISPATPFGGYKQSGFGREGGRAGIEEMVRRKTVFMAP